MNYVNITLQELIADDQWNLWAPDTSTPFYSYIWKWLTKSRPYMFVLCYPEDLDEEELIVKEGQLTVDIWQWLKNQEKLFDRTYELIYSTDSGSTKTTAKFNDTPQASSKDSGFDDDYHVSTINSQETIGTLGTVEQLKKIQDIVYFVQSDFYRRFVIYVD